MKHRTIITAIAAVCLLCAGVCAGATGKSTTKDADGHTLVTLWKDYREASEKDLPKKRLAILDKIREESLKSGLAWDFFDCCRERYYTETSLDWKNREKISTSILSDARNFGNEAVIYRLISEGFVTGEISGEYLKSIIANSSSLKKSLCREFVNSDGAMFDEERCPAFIKNGISNDYDYILWSVYFRTGVSFNPRYASYGRYARLSEAYYLAKEELQNIHSGKYPQDAFLEYMGIMEKSGEERTGGLEAFASAYSGQAVSLLAKQELLSERHSALESQIGKQTMSQEALSDKFKELRSDCLQVKKEAGSYKGKDAEIAKACTKPEAIVSMMDNSYVEAVPGEKSFKIVMVNTTRAMFELRKDNKEGAKVLNSSINDSRKLYRVPDTVEISLPPLEDGNWYYSIAAKEKEEGSFKLASLSIADRTVGNKAALYVAWQDSGEPIAKGDLTFRHKGKTILTIKDFSFNGFTELPEDTAAKLAALEGGIYVTCSFTDDNDMLRSSPEHFISLNGKAPYFISDDRTTISNGQTLCSIFKDSPAYRPSDTLKFKVVAYSVHNDRSMKVLPEGHSLKAELINPEGKTISEKKLILNDFGSSAGEFSFPKGGRNGNYRLKIYDGGYEIGSIGVQVDNFILPNWTIGFDTGCRNYIEGETVVLEGCLKSFSGHPVTASISTIVTDRFGEKVPFDMSQDESGRFTIRFKAPENEYTWDETCTVKVKATDTSGETAEDIAFVRICSSLDLRLSVENVATSLCQYTIPDSDKLILICRSKLSERKSKVSFSILSNGKVLLKKEGFIEETCEMSLEGLPSGIYEVKAEMEAVLENGRKVNDSRSKTIMKVSDSDSKLDFDTDFFVKKTCDGCIIGGTNDPLWAVAELYGPDGKVLRSEFVTLSGERGTEGSLRRIHYEFTPDMPDAVALQVFWFRNGSSKTFYTTFIREDEPLTLPLEVESFTDRFVPGGLCSFRFKSSAECEGVAAIFDKSYETFVSNLWYPVKKRPIPISKVWIKRKCGGIKRTYFAEEEAIPFSLKSTSSARMNDAIAEDSADVGALDTGVAAPATGSGESVGIRDDFRTSLAFIPFLRPDESGNISFCFNASDKASTFIVSLFVHDKSLRNAVLRKEMTVTLPVKISFNEPQFLYSGDKVTFATTVSSVLTEDISGTAYLYLYSGNDHKNSEPYYLASMPLSIPAGGSSSAKFDITAPEGLDTMGIKMMFISDTSAGRISDGIFVTVPVYAPEQTLTEAHSAVLTPGASREEIEKSIEATFVNVSPFGAESYEKSLIDLVMEAVPEDYSSEGKDVISLAKALYINMMSNMLRSGNPAGKETNTTKIDGRMPIDAEELLNGILSCQNADGGFGWFEGMKSSPAITACLLEWADCLRSKIPSYSVPAEYDEVISSAVKYLDSVAFRENTHPWWCGGISMNQYLYVRSIYACIPFDKSAVKKESLKKFADYSSSYLIPKKGRGLQGDMLGKALRIKTLVNLCRTGGERLAKELSIKGLSRGKIVRSIKWDIQSIAEYAQLHPAGGLYYPNASAHQRGILEGELYAHSILCDLFDNIADMEGFEEFSSEADSLADGLRLRMMISKESGEWKSDPATVNAINSILRGGKDLFETKIIVMQKRYVKPFEQIKASGNGFSISRSFLKCGEDGKYIELSEGDELRVGDKVKAVYSVQNDENRSFVRISAPRFANLKPVEQMSGLYRSWWTIDYEYFRVLPQGYREVRSDRTIWYFDSYPDFKTKVEEEFYVVRPGRFQAPAVEIESLYAPHYRANGNGSTILNSLD